MKKRIPKEEFDLIREARKAARKICEEISLENKIKNSEYVEHKKRNK